MADQKIPTTKGPMTPFSIISELTYSCYVYNRREGMTVESLKRCFPTTAEAMEKRYQEELTVRLDNILAGCTR